MQHGNIASRTNGAGCIYTEYVRTIYYRQFSVLSTSVGLAALAPIICALRSQSAIARIHFITNKVSLAIELDPDMEHIGLPSHTSLRRVRLVAHALAPQVESELLEGMQQQYTTHSLYCAQRRATF